MLLSPFDYYQRFRTHLWLVKNAPVARPIQPVETGPIVAIPQVGALHIATNERLQKLFQLANIANGHGHRFRNTFPTELLHAGVPLERVAILLGHQSVRVTEKYYAPWTESRQRQIESDLERAWARDPIVLLETKGTPRVHERN